MVAILEKGEYIKCEGIVPDTLSPHMQSPIRDQKPFCKGYKTHIDRKRASKIESIHPEKKKSIEAPLIPALLKMGR